jgi:hypothetical protein
MNAALASENRRKQWTRRERAKEGVCASVASDEKSYCLWNLVMTDHGVAGKGNGHQNESIIMYAKCRREHGVRHVKASRPMSTSQLTQHRG